LIFGSGCHQVRSNFHFRPVDPFGFQLSTCTLRPGPVFISVEALGLPGLASSPEARSAPPWRFRFLSQPRRRVPTFFSSRRGSAPPGRVPVGPPCLRFCHYSRWRGRWFLSWSVLTSSCAAEAYSMVRPARAEVSLRMPAGSSSCSR
jgi:hypothetical protein